MHHLLKHINQDITRRLSKDKASTVNKTEYRSKRNPTCKSWWAQQTAKASGPFHLINRPTGLQLKRNAKLPTVIGLTTMHAVCCNLLGSLVASGRVLDSRPRGRGFEPHWRNCVVVLEQDIFILA